MREFELLKHIYAANPSLPARVILPPGDDMGAVRLDDQQLLVTVDQVADGVHFRLEEAGLAKAARKAMTRNLSDVAAMAAQPLAAVAAACLPRSFTQAQAQELCDHLRAVAHHYDCPLIGGDISTWDHPLILSLTILASPAGIEPVLRRGAQPGDLIYVSGELGGSLEQVNGRVHHLDFEPRLRLARLLAGNPATRPHCMLDLSDGLARDAGHLAQAAGLRAQLWADRLPLSPAALQACRRDGQPAWRHALADGEDYELCFTLPADRATHLPAKMEGVPLTQIGRMVKDPGSTPVLVLTPEGQWISTAGLGWEHQGPA